MGDNARSIVSLIAILVYVCEGKYKERCIGM